MNFSDDQNDLNKYFGISPMSSGGRNSRGNRDKSGPQAGIFDIFVSSIMKVKKLVEISINSSRRFVAYVIFLSLFVGTIIFAVPTVSRIVAFKGLHTFFSQTLPSIKMDDGELTADKKFEMPISGGTLILDTSKKEFKYGDFEEPGIYIAIGSQVTKMVSITSMGIGKGESYTEIYTYPNSFLFINGFDNNLLVKLIPAFYIAFVFVFLFECVIVAAKYLILSFFYMTSTRYLTSVSKEPLTTSDSFRLCFYAQTIGIILVNVNETLGIIPSLFGSLIGIIITVIIIHKAMGPYMPDVDEIFDMFDEEDKNNSDDKNKFNDKK